MSMRKALFGAVMWLGCAFTLQAEAAAVLVQNNGIYTGATAVSVEGTLYDVTFGGGSCFTNFDECNSNTDFDFTTASSANAAAQALVDLFGSTYRWPTNGGVQGCSSSATSCWIAIPYNLQSLGSGFFAVNIAATLLSGSTAPSAPDPSGLSGRNPTFEFNDTTWAAFTRVAPVPLPGALPLLLTGFGVLAGMRLVRRRSGATQA